MLFEMNIAICERFPALDPFVVRQTKAHEVFLLVGRLNEYTGRKEKKQHKGQCIRKPAGDNWF